MGSTNQTLKRPVGSSKELGRRLLLHDSRGAELDGPEEHRAGKLLNDMLHRVEAQHGPLPTENLSKLLYQRLEADWLPRFEA